MGNIHSSRVPDHEPAPASTRLRQWFSHVRAAWPSPGAALQQAGGG